MELKLITAKMPFALQDVLIVPYGIETSIVFFVTSSPLAVLIVPYGIETSAKLASADRHTEVLIVPYGIETFYR